MSSATFTSLGTSLSTSLGTPSGADRTVHDGLRIVTIADRPDLAAAVPAVLASRWPVFMLAGRPGHDRDLAAVLRQVPEHQVALIDPADNVLGVGLSVPLRWDGTPEGLPAGWDGAVSASAELLDRGATATAACALSITIAPEAAGRGLAVDLVHALKDTAARAGVRALITPVRPALKERYPLIAMSDYVTWRTPDGRAFDPWLRLHLRAGATRLTVADPSMTITGTVAEWTGWTGLAFPGSGSFIVPGGLAPLVVDLDAGTGRYQEANVWVAHPLG